MKLSTFALLFLGGISGALSAEVQVFYYPAPSGLDLPEELTPKQSKIVVAQQLGLEWYETLDGEDAEKLIVQRDFVGKGVENSLLLTIQGHAEDVIPEFIPFFRSEMTSPSSLISNYINRAGDVYTHVFSGQSASTKPSRILDEFDLPATEETAAFKEELGALLNYYDSEDDEKFGAFSITSLSQLADRYGMDSTPYSTAAFTFAVFVKSLAEKGVNMVIVSYPEPTLNTLTKRQQPPQSPLPPSLPKPAEPISAISTCFTSETTCTESTNSCSGHGKCVAASKAGRTCYVCACSSTRSTDGQGKNKTHSWAGTSCEREDVSSEFVLLAGSAIALILLVVGSVTLLAGVGGQELPSTLTGGAVGASKKD
ncbi:Archenteron Induction-Related [Abortiporus biennis]